MLTTRNNNEERRARIDGLVELLRGQNANSDTRRGVPSRERAVMPTRSTPQDGDIVVREEKRGGTLAYVLHTAPGADQYEFRRREEGIAQALALAKRQCVRAWLTDEGYDFVLLEDFREVELV